MSKKSKNGKKLKRPVPLPPSDSELSANDVVDMLASDDELLTLNNKTKSSDYHQKRTRNNDDKVDAVDQPEPFLGKQFDSGTRHSKDAYSKIFSEKLPVKTKKGTWKVLQEEYVVDRNESEDDNFLGHHGQDEKECESEGESVKTACNFDEGKKSKTFEEKRNELAKAGLSLTQDPEHNLKQLSFIKEMIQDEQMSNLALTSLLAVFIDILPGYSIRPLTEQERTESVSKEVKQTRQFEQGLLKHYRDFLVILRDRISNNDTTSMQIAGQLLVSCNHFNYADQLIQWISHKAITGNQVCCNAFKELFENDLIGRVTMEAVRNISNAIKDRGYDKFNSPLVLQALLSVDLRETAVGMGKGNDNTGADWSILRKQKKALQHRSRKERKDVKKQKEVAAKQLAEETVITKEQRQKWSTETLRFLFRTYFGILTHILKTNTNEEDKKKNNNNGKLKRINNNIKLLVPAVMSGMGKFHGYISVEYFSDLTTLLRKLISLDMKHRVLTPIASLNCILTVLHIHRSNQCLAPMDLKFAYDYLYWLTDIVLSSPTTLTPNICTEDAGCLYEKCLKSLFIRQTVPINRVCAFIHRLANTSNDKQLSKRLECILMLFDQHPASRCIIDNDPGERTVVSNTHIVNMDPDLGDARIKNLDLSNGLERAIRGCKKEEQGKLLSMVRQIKQFGIVVSQKDV